MPTGDRGRSAPRGLQIISWCLFDFANSSFTTVVVTAVFSVWFVSGVCAGREDGTTLWSIAVLISNLLIIITAPVVGAIADHGGRKKPFLFLSYLLCVLATALLFFADRGDLLLAMGLFVIANFAFASGENLVAGFLPELAEPEDMAKVSSWGWAIGYLGGLGALALSFLAMKHWPGDLGKRVTNIVVAVFFLVGGLPTFLFVGERVRQRMSLARAARIGLAESRETLRQRAELRDLFAFLLAAMVLQIGVYGVIQFAGIYGSVLAGLAQDTITLILGLSQFSAVAGALLAGGLARRLGALRMVTFTALGWIAAAIILLVAANRSGFIVAAQLAGFSMGASLTSVRAVVGLFAPAGKSGEIFGFWGQFGRLAAVLAPAGNALALELFHDDLRAGIVLYALCFMASILLFARVDEKRGREAARRGAGGPAGMATSQDRSGESD